MVTPYVSYAEGYRAPSITETLVNGPHAGATANSAFFVCPSGTPAPPGVADSTFCFLPNPNLRPEVGKTKEIGFNVRKNDLFAAGDSFRGKFNFFRNDVTDFIDQVSFGPPLVVPTGPPGSPTITVLPFLQYQNIAQARIQGFEAETMYDANSWFVGVAGYLSGWQERPDRRRFVQHPAAEGHHDGRRALVRKQADTLGDVDLGDRQQEYSHDLSRRERPTISSTCISHSSRRRI